MLKVRSSISPMLNGRKRSAISCSLPIRLPDGQRIVHSSPKNLVFGIVLAVPKTVPCARDQKTMIPHTMTTTAFELDGYAVTRNLGVVRGIIVRSRSVIGTIGASLQTLIGGNITILTELCEKTRAEAFALMLEHAQQLGANAVVGIHYDATEVMAGVTEVLCYGTALVVARV